MENNKEENEKNNEEKNEEKKEENNEEKNNDFENLNQKKVKKGYDDDDMVDNKFFSSTLAIKIGTAGANIGKKIGGAIDSVAKVGRKIKKKFKSTFSKKNMKKVGNKIKYAVSKEGLKDAGRKISNAGSSIKTKALGLRLSSNMNSFAMLKLKDVLEEYSESKSEENFLSKIKNGMQDYGGFVRGRIRSWLKDNDERIEALKEKIDKVFGELDLKFFNDDWLKKNIPSFSKKIRIEILKKGNCIGALKSHLEKYGKIDPLWDILTRGSKITKIGALKSKTIRLLPTMTDCLSTYKGNNLMDVGVYANSLMSYLLKNFKGKGENKDSGWKLRCGLLLVRYSQQEGSYFDSLGKMVDERVNKIHKSISSSKKLSKLQKSCKTIPEMLDKASESKKGTASIAIGVGISYSNPVAIEVLKKVYTANRLPSPDTASIQNNSGSIFDLVNEIHAIFNNKKTNNNNEINNDEINNNNNNNEINNNNNNNEINNDDEGKTKYDTDEKYQKWFDDLYKISKINGYEDLLYNVGRHYHLDRFENIEEFKKYMEGEYKKEINDKYGKTLEEYKKLLEDLKEDLSKYSSEEFDSGTNPGKFKIAEKNLEEFEYMLSNKFIEDEINKELKKKAEEEKAKEEKAKKEKREKNRKEKEQVEKTETNNESDDKKEKRETTENKETSNSEEDDSSKKK